MVWSPFINVGEVPHPLLPKATREEEEGSTSTEDEEENNIMDDEDSFDKISEEELSFSSFLPASTGDLPEQPNNKVSREIPAITFILFILNPAYFNKT